MTLFFVCDMLLQKRITSDKMGLNKSAKRKSQTIG